MSSINPLLSPSCPRSSHNSPSSVVGPGSTTSSGWVLEIPLNSSNSRLSSPASPRYNENVIKGDDD